MCYDQMVQTQKRELIKKMLDCAIGRMLEYKKKIVQLDYTDYQYVFYYSFNCHQFIKKCYLYRWPDDILNQMKFTPDDVELFASVYGRERVEERRKFIQKLVESVHEGSQLVYCFLSIKFY